MEVSGLKQAWFFLANMNTFLIVTSRFHLDLILCVAVVVMSPCYQEGHGYQRLSLYL